MNNLKKHLIFIFVMIITFTTTYSLGISNNEIFSMKDMLYNPMYNLVGIDRNLYNFESNLKISTPKSTKTELIIDFNNKTATIQTSYKDGSAIYNYSYKEFYSFIKDFGNMQMLKMWNNTFSSNRYLRRRQKENDYSIDWKNSGIQNSLKIFGGSGTKIDVALGGSAGIDFTKTTSNIPNTYDAGMQSDVQFDFNSKFNVKLGDRANANVEFATSKSGEFTTSGDNIVAEFLYKGKDSLDLEDNILQEIHAGWNIDMSFNSLDLVKTNFMNNSHGIKIRTKFGFINMNTVIAVAESPTKKATENGSSSSNLIESYNFNDNAYFFLDSTFSNDYKWNTQNKSNESPIDKKTFELYISIPNNDTKYRVEANGDPIYSSYMDFVNGRYIKSALPKKFIKIKSEYYRLDPKSGYIKLNKNIIYKSENSAIAVYYLREDGTSDVNYITHPPTTSSTDNMLKLIKPEDKNVSIDNPYYKYYRWPNVYKLDMMNIDDISNIKVNIFRKDGNGNHINHNKNGILYSKLLGITDDKGLINKNFVDAEREYIIFPIKRPFDNSSAIEKEYLSPKIYDSTASISKNIFSIDIKGGDSYIKLEHSPVVSGSERIEAGGSILSKGTDYDIDYISGEINLKSANAIANADNLTIEYNYEELFSISNQLTVANNIGVNLYDLSDNFGQRSSINLLWLWHDEYYDNIDKIEIGQEPFSNSIIGGNLKLGYNIPILTKLINKIPGVKTDAMSKVDISGEFVHINPNPLNSSKNEVLIDNFENSSNLYPISLYYENWQFSSKPLDSVNDRADSSFWYTNNYVEYPVKDIWPDKEVTSSETGIRPMQFIVASDDTNQWAGITQYINLRDITNYNYIDIWVRVNPNYKNATPGTIHIDMGDISEDINGDEKLNKEGKIDDFRYNINVDDYGLNELTDAQEIEVGIPYKDDNHIKVDNQKKSLNPDSYKEINQTEGNGKRDTEDLDKNQQLNLANNYYSYSINMKKPITQSGIFSDSSINGWKHYRIPITLDTLIDVISGKIIGFKPEKKINYVRLWFEQPNVGETMYQIASFNITGNHWEAKIGGIKDFNPLMKSEDIFISTINNQEDAATYDSPINDIIDKQEKVIIKEEAVKVNFINLEPGHEANITKNASSEEWNFIKYDTLSFFAMPGNDSYDVVYTRLYTGVGTTNDYYEISMPLENKDYLEGKYKWTEFNFPIDSLLHAKKLMLKGLGGTHQFGNYKVKIVGNPVISDVSKITLGVLNNTIRPISGTVMFNELRLKGVEKNSGNKFEFSAFTSLADITSTTSKISFKDNYYHEIDERFGDDNSTLRGNIGNTFNIDKFQLYKYGFKIPVTTGISRVIKRPSYYGDIQLSNDNFSDLWDDFSKNNNRGFNPTISEEFQEVNNSKSIGISLSKNRQKNLELIKYINPLNLIDEFLLIRSKYDYGYSNSDNLSISQKDTVKINVGAWNLDLSKKGETYSFGKKKRKRSNFMQLKNDLGFNTGFNINISQNFNYKNQNFKNRDIIINENTKDSTLSTFVRNRDVTLNQSLATSYNLFNIMPISWGLNIAKDISNDVDSAYAHKTGTATTEIVDKSLKMQHNNKIDGIFYNESSHSQNFNMTFNPNLVSFIKTTSRYKSTYSQSYFNKGFIADTTETDTNTISIQQPDSTGNSLDLLQNNNLDLTISLDLIKTFSLNKRWRKLVKSLKRNRFRKISFNYTRKESQNIYNVNDDNFSFNNYGSLIGYQHGFANDTRLFSDKKSRFFYNDTNSSSTKKLTGNNYKWSTGFMPYNPLMIKYTPNVKTSKEEYIHIEDNRTTSEYNPFDMNWSFKNYKNFKKFFKKTSFSGSFKRKNIYEYNYDSTVINKTYDNNWKIINSILSLKKYSWSFASQLSYDWQTDSTINIEELSDGSWRDKSMLNFMLKPTYSKAINYFINIKGKKFRINKVELGFPFSFSSTEENMSNSLTPDKTRTYEFKPEAKAYLWKNRITSKAYISWSRNSDIIAQTSEDLWRFGMFFQVNFKTSK